MLAALHAVSPDDVGLGAFGRAGNYYERQISRWSKQYVASRTEDVPEMDALMEWLPRHIPAADETVVVHGDYRLGNAIVHPREPRIVAVLDWELSTRGHPLADLGYVCQTYYADEDDQHGLNRPNLHELGIPTEEQFVSRYCEMAGRGAIENWRFYLVYNLFRSAAIIQGVYRRGSTAMRAPTPLSASKGIAGCGRSGRGGSPVGVASEAAPRANETCSKPPAFPQTRGAPQAEPLKERNAGISLG